MILLSVYSDGSSDGGTGKPIGWAYAVTSGDELLVAGSGSEVSGTNNTAELLGAIRGLEAAHLLKLSKLGLEHDGDVCVSLMSDSKYVVGLGQGIYQPTANVELVTLLKKSSDAIQADFVWVKGHGGNKFNEFVDKLAREARMERIKSLEPT
jgi:ribonuclease HI